MCVIQETQTQTRSCPSGHRPQATPRQLSCPTCKAGHCPSFPRLFLTKGGSSLQWTPGWGVSVSAPIASPEVGPPPAN